MITPEAILENPEHRDVIITVLNALDNRTDPKLRAMALIEIATAIIDAIDAEPSEHHADQAIPYLGALVGLTMRICDDTPDTKRIIDDFRHLIRDAAQRG